MTVSVEGLALRSLVKGDLRVALERLEEFSPVLSEDYSGDTFILKFDDGNLSLMFDAKTHEFTKVGSNYREEGFLDKVDVCSGIDALIYTFTIMFCELLKERSLRRFGMDLSISIDAELLESSKSFGK